MNNYTTHMLENFAGPVARGKLEAMFPKSASRMRQALELLAQGEKFIMPDYGRVFKNGTRPTDFQDLLRLPAPVCVLEFHCPRRMSFNYTVRESDYFPKRRIVLCVDTAQVPLGDLYGIVVIACFEVDDGLWTFSPAGAMLTPDTMTIDTETGLFSFDHFPFMREVYDRGYSHREAAADLSDEVIAAVEFMITVNCENVKRERIEAPAKLNKKRTKNGKTPFYSYWLLDVFKEGRARGAHAGGSHSSPRFHFRRGHIRRYRDEAGNIKFTRFIARMAVGNATLGRVDKTYNLNHMEKNQ